MLYAILFSLQVLGIIFLFAEIIRIRRQRASRLQTILVILMYSILINVIGYTFEMRARDVHMALQAVRFSYFGKPFITFNMFLFVMEYCEVKIPRVLENFLLTICIIISCLVFSCEYQHLYYASIDFTQSGLFPHLVLTHGPLYKIYTFLLGGYFLYIMYVCARKIIHNPSALVRKQTLSLILMLWITITGLLVFLSGITGGYDSTLLAYIVSSILFERLIHKYRLFDTLSLAKEEAIDHFSDGLIVLNPEGKMVYHNLRAQQIIGTLASTHDHVLSYLKEIQQKSEPLFVKMPNDPDHSHREENEACVYTITLRDIVQNQVNYGQMMTLSEITDNYYYTERLQKEVARKTKEVVSIQRNIIGSFVAIIEARDGITGLHIKNTSNFVYVLVHAMHNDPRYADIMTEDYAEMIANAAHLHDIGKISIPDSILQKKGKLTEEEFEIMKSHPQEGAKILESTLKGVESDEYFEIAHDMALYHHEKYDGSGYPCHLKGTQIPLSARIMAVADVYDALRSKRHYKECFSREKSMQIIQESRGSHFDPDIAEIFLAHIDEIESVMETTN